MTEVGVARQPRRVAPQRRIEFARDSQYESCSSLQQHSKTDAQICRLVSHAKRTTAKSQWVRWASACGPRCRLVMALNHKKPAPRNGNRYSSRSQRPKPGGVASTFENAWPPPSELARISRTFQYSCWSNCTSVLYSTCPRKFSSHAQYTTSGSLPLAGRTPS